MTDCRIVPYAPEYAEETVRMWRESKERAIGQKDSHSFSDHVAFLNEVLQQKYRVELSLADGKVAGMIAYSETEISQLYIGSDFQGRGIGQALLDRAKAQSSGSLTLYTFEVNKQAQRFYEKNGFRVVGSGYENEEGLPDLKYEWIQN